MTLYRTIVMELLKEHSKHPPIPCLDRYSASLRDAHQQWIDLLEKHRPGSNSSVIATKALEMAIQDLQQQLRAQTNSETLSLDEAMSFLRSQA